MLSFEHYTSSEVLQYPFLPKLNTPVVVATKNEAEQEILKHILECQKS